MNENRYPLRTLVLFLLLGIVAGLYAAELARTTTPDHKAMALFAEVYDKICENYVTDVDRVKLAQEAVRGMLRGLDPYSAYFTREEYKHFQEVTRGSYEGLGIRIIMKDGWLTVETPFRDGPATKAGVLAGDRIEKINGESTRGITLQEAVRKLKGPRGSKVTITVRHRDTGKVEDIVVIRDRIEVPSTAGIQRKPDGEWLYWLVEKERIGYVRLAAFQLNTAEELRKVVDQLHGQGLRGLILDMRFNPGGLLGAAVDVADLFVSEGVIVSTRTRNVGKDKATFSAKKEGTYESFPVVMLANGRSASASEIVAGALQDHRRGKLVGSRTFGKGSVQSLLELDKTNQGAVKLTVAAYYTPSGKSLYAPKGAVFENGEHKASGLIPDYTVELTPDEQDRLKAYWARLERNETSATKPARSRPAPLIDKQLQKALEVVREQISKANKPVSQ